MENRILTSWSILKVGKAASKVAALSLILLSFSCNIKGDDKNMIQILVRLHVILIQSGLLTSWELTREAENWSIYIQGLFLNMTAILTKKPKPNIYTSKFTYKNGKKDKG